jgi:hypothetical protein
MQSRLTFQTAALSVDRRIDLDRQLARLPGVHHVQWSSRPIPQVEVVFADEKYVDHAAAERVLQQAGLLEPATA